MSRFNCSNDCPNRSDQSRLENRTNSHSKRLEDARKILWGFDTASKRNIGSDGFPALISLAEGGSLRRPSLEVLLNIQNSLFSPEQYEPGTYYFDQFLPELGSELQRFFREEFGLSWAKPENICIGVGSSHILDGLFSAVLEAGDLVLTPAPFYHAFADFTLKWGASIEVVSTDSDSGFKLLAKDLEQWFTSAGPKASQAKILLLTNPSLIGAVYSRDELIELASVIRKHKITVFVDEVYRESPFPGTAFTSLGSLSGMEEFVVTAHSGSKTRGFADLRIGWACGPAHLVKEIIHFAEHSVTLVPLITQRAALDVLRMPQSYFDLDRSECERRATLIRDLVLQVNLVTKKSFGVELISMPVKPEAGHGILLDFSRILELQGVSKRGIGNSLQLTRYFGELSQPDGRRCGVLFAPCYSNGMNGLWVRAAFAEVGHNKMDVNLESEVFAAFSSLIKKHSKISGLSEERISAAARLVGLEGELSETEQQHRLRLAFAHGRALIGEAFARVAYGLLELGSRDNDAVSGSDKNLKEAHLSSL